MIWRRIRACRLQMHFVMPLAILAEVLGLVLAWVLELDWDRV